MRSYLLLLLCFFGAGFRLQAQTIEPGYLVLTSGDTLRGELENAFWSEPPTSVRFRPAASSALTTYQAADLRAIGLASGRLLRKEVLPIDRSAQKALPLLSTAAQKNQRPEELFADVLVIGPAMLLGVTVNNVHHFFVRRENQPYLEMTERHYLKVQNGRQTIMDGNDYRSQLLLYFGDCAPATQVSTKAPFTAAGLTAVVQAYNQSCSAARQVGQAMTGTLPSAKKVAIRFGVLAGARYNSLPIEGGSISSQALVGLNVDGRVHPQAGGYLDVVAGGRRFGLHTAVLVSQFGNAKSTTFQNGQFRWHGTMAAGQIGIRSFIPLGEKTRIVLGLGYEIITAWNFTSRLDYRRETYQFLHSLGGAYLYGEAGVMRGRYGLTFHGRNYGEDFFADLTVPARSLSAVLSYRLNADSDSKSNSKR